MDQITVGVPVTSLPMLLAELVDVDVDTGLSPALSGLGQALVDAVRSETGLRMSATGAHAQDLAELLDYARQRDIA